MRRSTMDKELLNFSFDEIVNSSGLDDANEDRLAEIKRYEKIYLLKQQNVLDSTVEDIDGERLISLYNNVEFNGFRRNYMEDLSERDYTLEGCTPYQIIINDVVLEDGSWGDILCKLAIYLLDQFPEKMDSIEEFRAPWTKTAMFSSVKKTNFKSIGANLFLNCNHTALHSCWLVQDLLDYFGVKKSDVRLLIHRPSSAEKGELKQHIEKLFLIGFKKYICSETLKEQDYADKVVNNITKFINPVLCNMSKSYQNIFLFDDLAVASGYIGKLKNTIKQSFKYDEKAKKVLCKYLTLLQNYYKM